MDDRILERVQRARTRDEAKLAAALLAVYRLTLKSHTLREAMTLLDCVATSGPWARHRPIQSWHRTFFYKLLDRGWVQRDESHVYSCTDIEALQAVIEADLSGGLELQHLLWPPRYPAETETEDLPEENDLQDFLVSLDKRLDELFSRVARIEQVLQIESSDV